MGKGNGVWLIVGLLIIGIWWANENLGLQETLAFFKSASYVIVFLGGCLTTVLITRVMGQIRIDETKAQMPLLRESARLQREQEKTRGAEARADAVAQSLLTRQQAALAREQVQAYKAQLDAEYAERMIRASASQKPKEDEVIIDVDMTQYVRD